MIHSEPYITPVDWKKEVILMRQGAAKRKTKKAALQILRLAGIDMKTGRVMAKTNR